MDERGKQNNFNKHEDETKMRIFGGYMIGLGFCNLLHYEPIGFFGIALGLILLIADYYLGKDSGEVRTTNHKRTREKNQ